MDTKINEELLYSWLRLTTTISNDRLVSELPFNESLICHVLLHHGNIGMSPTELCQETKMVKSLMNRTLNSLEEKGMIKRSRREENKRWVKILLDESKLDKYHCQHERIISLIDAVMNQYGKDKAAEVVNMMTKIADIAQEVVK